MSILGLGRLKAVPPRQVWPHEALNFTPWLLENVDVLSDLLGMDLILEVAEHPVGDFRLDLKGIDEATGGVVIVENQLQLSDHTHLGQIITYAAGTDPSTIVWIAAGFRPEHRAAIDWLNERTDGKTRVFGVVIKVVQIGDSKPAPAFELVAQPNDWEKVVRKATETGPGTVSARALLYREFWKEALRRIRDKHPEWTRARTTDNAWCNTRIGYAGVAIVMVFRQEGLLMEIYFDDRHEEINKQRFDALLDRRQEFEEALGLMPEWDRMEGLKAARVIIPSDFMDVSGTEQWPEMINWLIETQLRVRNALQLLGERSLFWVDR